MNYVAGLDWGSAKHAACVIDADGEVILRLEVDHSAAGLAKLINAFARIAPAGELPVAIERPSGLIVDALIAAGHPVVPVHPNAVKASRPRYRAALSKSDPGDAYLLADLLRTDGHRFRTLVPHSDELRALRALTRTRDDLVAERVALGNQLRALLESFWPGAAVIFAAIDSPIGLAFLERYPTPESACRLGEKRLGSFLTSNGYSGRRPASELLERLRSAPIGHAGPIEQQAKGELVKAFVRILATLTEQIKDTTTHVERAVSQLPLGKLVTSFPRAGRINAAQIVAELGEDPQRFPSDNQLAAEAGVAPVTYQSGKRRGVGFRYACNKRLRRALTTWANNSRRTSPWAQQVYQQARARGCRHPHAVRILTRAWLRVLHRCWRDGTLYEPQQHAAAQHLLEAA
jgi:transposase